MTDAGDAQKVAAGAVRLTIRWPEANALHSPEQAITPFYCGDRIRAVARLLPPETYHDPGAWSRAAYLLDQGITSTASVNIERVERSGTSSEASLACRIGSWQRASSGRLLALPAAMHGLPAALRLTQQDAIMLAAMVTGDRTYLSHSLRVGFERTGSFHMLVVSGFHLAIVAGCIFWIAKRLRLPRVPATLVTIFASLAYALFTGFATPVQRSLWMVTLYLLGRVLYRERSPLNTIGFAALCLMAASPRSLFDASLQMTLLAVVSIGGIAAPLLQGTMHPYLVAARDLRLIAIDAKLAPELAQFRVTLRMVALRLQAAISRRFAWSVFPWTVRFTLRVVELLVVSCVVELAMTLPMAVYFHRITIFALPVNLLILPLLAILMPAALVTLLALLLWPAAAMVPGAIAAVLLHFGVGLVHLFGSMALGDFRIPTPLAAQSAGFCVLLAAALVLAGQGRWRRGLAWAALCGAALAAVAPPPIQHPHHALLMEAIDVGQGDSLLLITPEGKTLLVDGGGFGGGPRQIQGQAQEFDIGEEVVSAALWSRGIRRLDAVALSHAHSDHMGGLPAVLRNFHPTELWVGNNPHFGAYDALLDEAAGLHVRLRSLRAGDTFALGSTQVNVLAPLRNYQPGAEPTITIRWCCASGTALRRCCWRAMPKRCGAGDAVGAGAREHAAEGGPSRQRYLDTAGVSGARGATVGRHLLRAAQSLWPSPRGGSGRTASREGAHAAYRHERSVVLSTGRGARFLRNFFAEERRRNKAASFRRAFRRRCLTCAVVSPTSYTLALKTHAQSYLNLAFAIEVGRVDIQRLAEGGGVGSGAGEEVEGGQSARYAAGFDGVAGCFQLGHVLVVEEIEALTQQLQLAQVAEVEFLAHAHIGLPRRGVAVGVAAYAVDAVIAAEAFIPGARPMMVALVPLSNSWGMEPLVRMV